MCVCEHVKKKIIIKKIIIIIYIYIKYLLLIFLFPFAILMEDLVVTTQCKNTDTC